MPRLPRGTIQSANAARDVSRPIGGGCVGDDGFRSLGVFENFANLHAILSTFDEVGLGYLRLGQSAHTLSGGEAQRVKLATELTRPGNESHALRLG